MLSIHDVLRALVRGDRAVNDPAWQQHALAAIDQHEAGPAPAAAEPPPAAAAPPPAPEIPPAPESSQQEVLQ